MDSREFNTYHEVKALVGEFEAVLNRKDIDIQKNSELERLCLTPTDIVEKHLRPELRNPEEDVRPYFREFVGIQDLMLKIIRSSENPFFDQLIPHLGKLNNSIPLQNLKTSVRNQDNNKVFELFVATLCLGVSSSGITVDDPDISKGDNPDIIALIDGKQWGFGCKVLHSNKPKTLVDNIVKAVDQIEKSPSETGLPVISLKNVIDHDAFWPLLNQIVQDDSGEPVLGAFIALCQPLSMVDQMVDEIHSGVVECLGQTGLDELFAGKKSQPVCLLYFPTTTSIVMNGMPVTTRLNVFRLLSFGEHAPEAELIAIKLNHQLQLAKP